MKSQNGESKHLKNPARRKRPPSTQITPGVEIVWLAASRLVFERVPEFAGGGRAVGRFLQSYHHPKLNHNPESSCKLVLNPFTYKAIAKVLKKICLALVGRQSGVNVA